MAQSGWLRGRVCSLKDDYGFIRVVGDLPQGYRAGKDVHFNLKDLHGVVQVGSVVDFSLNPGNKNMPSAALVKPSGDYALNTHTPQIHSSRRGQSRERPRHQSSGRNDDHRAGDRRGPSIDRKPPKQSHVDNHQNEVIHRRGHSADRQYTPNSDSKQPDPKRSRSGYNEFYLGEICTIAHAKNSGFIKPLQALPDDYPKDRDVQFQVNKVHAAGMTLQKGDKLHFTLGTQDKSNPKAFNMKLRECKSRSGEEICEFLGRVEECLKNNEAQKQSSSDTTEKEKETKSQYVIDLLTCPAVWESIGRCNSLTSQNVKTSLQILLEMREQTKPLKQNFTTVLTSFIRTPMMHPGNGALKRFLEESVLNGMQSSIELCQDFFLILFQYIPEKAHLFIPLTKLMVKGGRGSTEQFLFAALRQVTKCLVTDIEDMEWDELPLVPSVNELTGGPFESSLHLSPLKEKGPYESCHELMDINFRLLRADSFHSLRSGVKDYLAGKLDPRDMNIYHSIKLVGLEATHSESGFSLQLRMEPLKTIKDWSRCLNLMFGNLLCISPKGNFKDPVWATVVERDVKMLQTKSVVTVGLCSECNTMSDADAVVLLMRLGSTAVMAESPTYYRAYQPVLKALQSMNPEELSFQEELVQCKEPDKAQKIPSYITNQTILTDTSFVFERPMKQLSMNEFEFNLLKEATVLDRYQNLALRHGLRSRLAIIQGPPGTGKTYIGIKLVQTILEMSTKPKGPILALTYKNHALDEFLKPLVALYPGDVVRIGGRSKDPVLAEVNLTEVIKGTRKEKDLLERLRDKYAEADYVRPKLIRAAKALCASQTFTLSTLLNLATENQIQSLLLGCDWRKIDYKIEFRGKRQVPNWQIIQHLMQETSCSLVSLLKMPTTGKEKPHILKTLFRLAFQNWQPDKTAFHSMEDQNPVRSLSLNIVKQKEKKTETEDSLFDEDDIFEAEQERMVSSNQQKQQKVEVVSFGNQTNEPSLLPAAMQMVESLNPLMMAENLWDLTVQQRVVFVQYLLLKQSSIPQEEFEKVAKEYQQLCIEKSELEEQHKVSVLAGKKIIGMTITGASIHQELLARVKPSIIVIEEAAEVLEPQVLAVLGSWVKHLILIGDHKQLKPPVENFLLQRDYKFDLSMMERMINNDIKFCSLGYQNRMRSEFAELLLDIYPSLMSNTKRIHQNIAATCIERSMFFWHHCDPETGRKEHMQSDEGPLTPRSYSNELEAERVVKLALFLIQQGYQPSQITVLGAYQGQVALLRKKFKDAEAKWPDLLQRDFEEFAQADPHSRNKVKVYTIDMYQGDENDFVIVSLVRSHGDRLHGFLNLLNRRCVAQSRAKCGLYFVGNTELLSTNPHWKTMIAKMDLQGCVGKTITLKCPRHEGSTLAAEKGNDIDLGTFCFEECTEKMPCHTHKCPSKCQPPHGHTYCSAIVTYTFPDCGHTTAKECSGDGRYIECKKPCQSKMDCKLHACPKKCSPKHGHGYCIEKVDFYFPDCGHKVEKRCSDSSPPQCNEEVPFKFDVCGHAGTKRCHQRIQDVKCKEKCTKSLTCGHPCTMKCSEPCEASKCKVCETIRKQEAERQRKAEELARKKAIEDARKEIDELKQKPIEEEASLKELSQHGDTAAEYFMVEDMVKKYVQPTHKFFPHVTKIEKVVNYKLRMKWLEAKQKLFEPGNSALKFHGTSEDAVSSIIKEGFRLPQKGGMYGRGVYFATDSSKSAQDMYTKGSNTLLLCDVLLGRSKTVESAKRDMTFTDMLSMGYDSLYAKRGTKDTSGVLYDEFVIYNPAQAMPCYVIHYEKAGPDSTLQLSGPSAPLGTTMKIDKIMPKRQFNPNDQLDLHFRMAESQFLRLMSRSGQSHQITSVELYTNPPLMKKFQVKKDEMVKKYPGQPEAEPILAFHGTNPVNIPSIMSNNFDIKRLAQNTHDRGFYGAGIYFSEFPGVSIGYGGSGSLILCEVLPGRSYDCPQKMEGISLKSGYDSHRAQRDSEGRGQEIVIFDADQILPRYVIHFK